MAAPISKSARFMISQVRCRLKSFSLFNKQSRISGVNLCTQSSDTEKKIEDGKNQPETSVNKKTVNVDELQARYVQPFDPVLIKSMCSKMKYDLPITKMPDPFLTKHARCFLCDNDIELDWKNVRLLSQFVSPYTGRIYGRHITGLCIPMQKRVAKLIKRARMFGYMAYMNKDPDYLQDPLIFNAFGRRVDKRS